MTFRLLVFTLCAVVAAGSVAGCGSAGAPVSVSAPTGSAVPVGSQAAPDTAPAADTPSQSASQAGFADLMAGLGFFPGGTPAYAVDAAGEAVCGNLGTESMSAEIAYEKSVDENSLTGMTTDKDIVTFVRDAVEAWCPQYAKDLPAQ